MTPGELVREFSHLTLAQVYDALSYYYDHKEGHRPGNARQYGAFSPSLMGRKLMRLYLDEDIRPLLAGSGPLRRRP
ncbi:MAG: hypothetical protein AB1816_10920 [Bacillota bacterium]